MEIKYYKIKDWEVSLRKEFVENNTYHSFSDSFLYDSKETLNKKLHEHNIILIEKVLLEIDYKISCYYKDPWSGVNLKDLKEILEEIKNTL